ncbi:MAG: phosphohistidine phosphatase SixA [Planctomycetes bacterium]|nr:phosphohistidine phosphatase SixA [Planctomycetota bacterium]
MLIYLLRHGIAEDGSASGRDHDRALTEDGRRRLRRAAGAWRRLCEPPQVVFASPLRRAQETAEVLVEAIGNAAELRTEAAFSPGGNVATAVGLLEAELLAGKACVACVGHEPHLGRLLGLLLTGLDDCPVPLRKGMLVGLETGSAASLAGSLRFALGQRAAGDLG